MIKIPFDIADFPPEVQAFLAAQAQEIARKDVQILDLSLKVCGVRNDLKAQVATLATERASHALAIKNRDTIIAELRAQLHAHKKHRFGSKSESSAQLALELVLEDLEIEQASETDDDNTSTSSDAESTKPARTPRTRKPFPKDLKRVQTTLTPSDACDECGGRFKELGEDVMEELEYVPGHYVVHQIKRPRLACTCCDKIVQAEMPSRALPKSFVGPALMAHILCRKYGYHLPLYRQSQMFENDGIDLSGSLMASWVGKCTNLLERLALAIKSHVFGAQAIFMDDTTVKLLNKGSGRGKNKSTTARMWVYVRDDRPWSGYSPPAAWYQFSSSREAKHPTEHLASFKGFAHADAYAGYKDSYSTGRITEMACMAHVRRDFVTIFERDKLAVAGEAVARIQKLYAVEAKARFLTPSERVALRQAQAKPIFDDLEIWLKEQLGKVSGKSPLAQAIRYALKRLPKARAYLDHGFLEIDNNAAERAMRPVAVGRKNYLFMGAEAGGKSAAIAYTLIETAKLNNVNPEAWLAWVLERIQDHPVKCLHELFPWAYQDMIRAQDGNLRAA